MYDIYKNKTVLVTGHTGFKGSWLSLWLKELGANLIGYSLAPNTTPNHFDLLDLDMHSIIADIRDFKNLYEVVSKYKPDIVFHLAAEPIVRESYDDPVNTFSANMMGTVNILEACRLVNSVQALLVITSDKCYDNKEWYWGYREIDPLGGKDPYSASKACCEIITNSYRESFFNLENYTKTHNTLVASCRAGNVIGGGDWSVDRLIPDIVKSYYENKSLCIRNPHSVRPWQYILDCLNGYLNLGVKLLEGEKDYADAWNFGPLNNRLISVGDTINIVKDRYKDLNVIFNKVDDKQEANLLKLDSGKSYEKLNFNPKYEGNSAILFSLNWYDEFYKNKNVISKQQIFDYLAY